MILSEKKCYGLIPNAVFSRYILEVFTCILLWYASFDISCFEYIYLFSNPDVLSFESLIVVSWLHWPGDPLKPWFVPALSVAGTKTKWFARLPWWPNKSHHISVSYSEWPAFDWSKFKVTGWQLDLRFRYFTDLFVGHFNSLMQGCSVPITVVQELPQYFYLAMYIVFTRGQFWPSGIVIGCVCGSVCQCVCVNHERVRTITHCSFKLRSPNLDQRCKTPRFRSLLFLGMIDLWPSRSNLTWKWNFT